MMGMPTTGKAAIMNRTTLVPVNCWAYGIIRSGRRQWGQSMRGLSEDLI